MTSKSWSGSTSTTSTGLPISPGSTNSSRIVQTIWPAGGKKPWSETCTRTWISWPSHNHASGPQKDKKNYLPSFSSNFLTMTGIIGKWTPPWENVLSSKNSQKFISDPIPSITIFQYLSYPLWLSLTLLPPKFELHSPTTFSPGINSPEPKKNDERIFITWTLGGKTVFISVLLNVIMV